jgi:fructosamine-3-kinase
MLGQKVEIRSINPEFGGNINESYKLETDQGTFFLKRNEATDLPRMFEREARGLHLLRPASTFKIPGVVLCGNFKEVSYLVLDYIEKGLPKSFFWQQFGTALAQQHKQSYERFGLDHDNYIGSLHQSNTYAETWAEFFTNERLMPLANMAHEKGKLEVSTVKTIEKICARLSEIFPAEPPSLLHGDLWSGNYLCTINSEPCVYDPAVYYGHREMDIAMMQLFGGFHSDCLKAYQEIYPLEKSWKQRVDICNLYPLLVHTILFGGSYGKQVKNITMPFA